METLEAAIFSSLFNDFHLSLSLTHTHTHPLTHTNTHTPSHTHGLNVSLIQLMDRLCRPSFEKLCFATRWPRVCRIDSSILILQHFKGLFERAISSMRFRSATRLNRKAKDRFEIEG